MKRFETSWYTGTWQNEEFHAKECSTKQAALNYYEKHKNDAGTFDWAVNKRNAYWEIVEDYIL